MVSSESSDTKKSPQPLERQSNETAIRIAGLFAKRTPHLSVTAYRDSFRNSNCSWNLKPIMSVKFRPEPQKSHPLETVPGSF